MKLPVALTIVLTIWALVIVGTARAQSPRKPVRFEGALIFEAPQLNRRPPGLVANFDGPANRDGGAMPVISGPDDFRQGLNLILDDELQKKLRVVHQACSLTEAQKSKLLLAGQGDIYRLVDQIAESGSGGEADDREGLMYFFVPEPGWSVFESRPSDDATLFAKTSRTVLVAEQLAAYERLVAPRQQPGAEKENRQVAVVNLRYVDARATAGLLDNLFADRPLRTVVRPKNILMIYGPQAQLDNCVKLLQRVESHARR